MKPTLAGSSLKEAIRSSHPPIGGDSPSEYSKLAKPHALKFPTGCDFIQTQRTFGGFSEKSKLT
jgi:hypothetical protein